MKYLVLFLFVLTISKINAQSLDSVKGLNIGDTIPDLITMRTDSSSFDF